MPITGNATDLVNADGSYNVALIMQTAHAKARAVINGHTCICLRPNGPKWRGRTFTKWVDEDAALAATATPAQLAAWRALRSWPSYAALVKQALKEIWFAARHTRQREIETAVWRAQRAAAALPAPMFLQAAE